MPNSKSLIHFVFLHESVSKPFLALISDDHDLLLLQSYPLSSLLLLNVLSRSLFRLQLIPLHLLYSEKRKKSAPRFLPMVMGFDWLYSPTIVEA